MFYKFELTKITNHILKAFILVGLQLRVFRWVFYSGKLATSYIQCVLLCVLGND